MPQLSPQFYDLFEFDEWVDTMHPCLLRPHVCGAVARGRSAAVVPSPAAKCFPHMRALVPVAHKVYIPSIACIW